MLFYIKESEASNHAVREAACTCIAELGNKISPDAVRPHVSQLITALLDSFHDESWPVRDGKKFIFYVTIVVLGIGFILNFISCTIELFFSLSSSPSPSLSFSLSFFFSPSLSLSFFLH